MNRPVFTRFVSAAFGLIALAAPLAAQDAGAKHERFEIALPSGFSAFTHQVQSVDAKDGKIETANWISKAPTGEAVVVTVSKMPGKILDPDKMMDSTRDGLLKSLKATLENEAKVEGDLAARKLEFKSDAAFLRARFAVDEDHFFQLLYVGRNAEQRAGEMVQNLFDSFRVVPAATAAATPAPAEPIASAKP